jgi:hypothetical protein
MMRNYLIAGAALLAAMTGTAGAQDLVTQVQQGCAAEIKQYCSQVMPGEGRLLACFYAHEDKLTAQCEYALYDAAAQLERAVSALNYVAGQCAGDIQKFCSSVAMGEGRIEQCLKAKGEEVSAGCRQAWEDVAR